MEQYKEVRKAFFNRAALTVAKDLLGRWLIHETPSGLLAGRVVETEAYDETDPASHSCHGRTERNAMMFESGGSAYVYRSYGIHWCLNVAAGPKGFGAAVLIRALEPILGDRDMAHHRATTSPTCSHRDLCRGPGRLCQALGVTAEHNGVSMVTSSLRFVTPRGLRRPESFATPRIGISRAIEAPWRFCIPSNRYVSGSTKLNRP
ncbi:uncharacterized protein METZ01_LOCUS395518 [marine metagenome]|uniref:3-methyladenine DNA glycosylase n=1 Tax=marine metagenome TaxID=408172 RepID=A0A382V858_9ZZZZ